MPLDVLPALCLKWVQADQQTGGREGTVVYINAASATFSFSPYSLHLVVSLYYSAIAAQNSPSSHLLCPPCAAGAVAPA